MRLVGVIAVDHQEAFRRSARTTVAGAAGFEWVAEAATAEEALEIAVAVRPGLALVELDMPGIGGLETAVRLKRAVPGIVVVVVSEDGAPDPDELEGSGAAAFVPKGELTPGRIRELWERHGHA
jgi:two-component system invasion response regulator UvrY